MVILGTAFDKFFDKCQDSLNHLLGKIIKNCLDSSKPETGQLALTILVI